MSVDEDIKIINIKTDKMIIKDLFCSLGIIINNLDELENKEIQRDDLLGEASTEMILKYQDDFKKTNYSYSKLTALHKNCSIKQKQPQINLIRQILKCNNLKLQPKVTHIGYTKTGQKIIKRSYVIIKL